MNSRRVNRCVRRGWLCGYDPDTGKCYEHGKQWIKTGWKNGPVHDPDGWLCPVCVDGDAEPKASRNRSRRASNKGYLPMGFEDYLRILD